ncbi:4Fe-4S dicluster domain-containing protein [Halovenus sp. WSH3]|uniref:4Fe-4S dicluster domain-containing protein n=1 Tax=Halovenus carboxidivorans TaxID=2692199 RepID=A0A6B0T911_9EURY|nr:LUD domain-containing protein [Halovenus carboxidivorans]MXR51731.1 4Fe-4S dicluster domain-containing protein [Halovenus carboxidivorans]
MSSKRGDREGTASEFRRLIETEGDAVGQNTRTVNQLSDYALERFDSYEELRGAAREIKEQAIEELPALIGEVDEAVEANGGEVHVAQTAADANRIVEEIMAEQDAQTLAKSKSMTTEEIEVNEHLESAGYDVIETDLGEYVIQLADEKPSHLIGPAMHKSPGEIAELFNREFGLTGEDALSENPQELTEFARQKVGERIREADVGMTGANFVVAETGTLMLVTNEGNARKTAVTPDTHIAVAGVEKLVPSLVDLQPFTELIARTGTGQDITSYVSLLTPRVDTPVPDFEADEFRDSDDRDFHLILLDNGRMGMREDEQLRETLYCIRCGACSNACSNFQAVGGHGFGGETYTGGIGTGWEAGVHGIESASEMNDLCTGCSRCEPKCPVDIDIPWINTVVRNRLNREVDADDFEYLVEGLHPDEETGGLDRQKWLFGNVETLAKIGSKTPRLANAVKNSGPGKRLLASVFGVDTDRTLPDLADETLREWYMNRGPQVVDPDRDVVLYPDLYTDYFDPERGKAAVRVLEALDVRVHIPAVAESGRAPLSQGMIETARSQAEFVYGTLVTHIDRGRDVVVIEPSDAAMFRDDYEKLLPEQSADRLAGHSYEICEFVYGLLENGREVDALSTAEGVSVAYHSHCQQRTLELAAYTEELLDRAGYDVRTSDVECCGMAGSFGYKEEYADVARAVGEHLRDDLGEVSGERIAASGTSCQTQLDLLYDRPVPHPVELLDPR